LPLNGGFRAENRSLISQQTRSFDAWIELPQSGQSAD
jgi:hypothetical protein